MRASSVVIATSLMVFGACNTALAETTLRFNRWIPATNFINTEVFDPWAADVAKVTEGRVKIQFTAASLAPPPQQFQIGVDGLADIVWHTHSYTAGVFPAAEIADLPMLGESAESLSVGFWRTYEKFLKAANEYKGTVVLSLHTTPPGHVFNNKRAIKSLEDFSGLKIRTTNAMVTETLQELGAVPIAAPVTSIADGLAKGVLDGTTFTEDAISNFKVDKYIKYETRFPGGLYNQGFVLAMNAGAWKKISADDQAKILALSGEAFAKRMGSVWDRHANAAAASLKANGVAIDTASGPMLDKVRTYVAKYERQWLEHASAKGVQAKEALAYFREQIRSYK